MNMLDEVNDEVSNFFREKGFTVTWDCAKGEQWYELYLKGKQFLQIDMGIPLEVILSDLKFEYEDTPYKSLDYQMSGSKKNFDKLLKILFDKEEIPA